ncbi:PKD repeats containing protein [Halapricum desulfuricans]|uniref:PKD repeats containing protein n=1 Tax=Halapricum desulfuricans TaxID=2841257 RepID=A0A897NKE7_9EURY|nr:type IV pilin N-terminal domain-containing protein [Halapricum desulfuricans]QSG13212.1 PKD repeats containing protein [Halapricum desulfuricans]
MVRPSRRGFLEGSALTLAALTGVFNPATNVHASSRSAETLADLDISAPFADAFLPVPAEDALSTTYATLIAERVDADTAEELSYRARSTTEQLDIDVDELSATVAVMPADRGIRLVTAAGGFDRLDHGETLAVGERNGTTGGESNDGPSTEAETTDELPAGWRLTDDGEIALVTGDGVAAAAIGSTSSSSPRGRSTPSGDDVSDQRIETVREAGRAAAGEADRFAASPLGAAALSRLGGFETVLLIPDADSGPFLSRVPDNVDAFAVGFETNPEDLRDIEGTVENAYVIRPVDGADGLDDETVERLVRTVDPAVPVETDITRTDGLVLVDAVVEAPPEFDREASPDARVQSRFNRAAGTVTFEHVEGEAVPADELEVWHSGEEVSDTVLNGEEFTAGDEITVETGLIATVTLRWFDPDANVYDTYASERVDREAFAFNYDMTAETLELTYEAERSADASNLRLVHRGESGVRTVGDEFVDGTLEPGDSVTVRDVSIGDSVRLEFDVEQPIDGGSLAHYRARPPSVWINSRAEEGTTVRYDGEESRPADAFVTLVNGEPTDLQFVDEYDTLSGDEELVLGELPLGSTVAVEWHEPTEPVVISEEEVVPNTHASMEYDPDAGEITVQHRGGRTLPASELELQASRAPTDVQPADKLDEFGPDDSFTAPVPPLSRVRLVWTGGEDEHYLGGTTTARDAVAATYDVDTEAMTIEYVGEQPADPERLRVSVTGTGKSRGRERDRESAFAAEYDELTAGDAITVDDVGLDNTVVVSVHTEFENGAATSSVAHFSATPRRGFVVDDGGDNEASGTTLRYVGEVRRDADAFRVLIDGEPATNQPTDETDRLTGGETLSLGDLSAGTSVAVEWAAGDETRTVMEHVIPPQATFEVTYESADDSKGGVVTFTHAGGDTLDADRVDVVVEPATDGLRPWDSDTDEVTAGDETSVTADTEPKLAVVVFNEHETLHHEPLNRDT